MPFGLLRLVTTTYIDDIIIFSGSFEDHYDHVRAVIEELKNPNFKILRDKCKFSEKLAKFLGHVNVGGTHAPDEEKIGVIWDLKRLKLKRKLDLF